MNTDPFLPTASAHAHPTGFGPAAALVARGWWVGPDGLPAGLVQTLRGELKSLANSGRLRRAGIGRGRDFQIDADQRGDRIRWLKRDTLAQCLFLDQMEKLRLELNRSLYLGLFEFECHFALYPAGRGYRRHLDSLRGAANRMVSVVIYLNDSWRPSDGGELVLYHADSDAELTRIVPCAGTMALFLSEEIPHQVLPARRPRASIAGWFRINSSHAGESDPAG